MDKLCGSVRHSAGSGRLHRAGDPQRHEQLPASQQGRTTRHGDQPVDKGQSVICNYIKIGQNKINIKDITTRRRSVLILLYKAPVKPDNTNPCPLYFKTK